MRLITQILNSSSQGREKKPKDNTYLEMLTNAPVTTLENKELIVIPTQTPQELSKIRNKVFYAKRSLPEFIFHTSIAEGVLYISKEPKS